MLEAVPRSLGPAEAALARGGGGSLGLELLEGGVQGGEDPPQDSQHQEHWGERSVEGESAGVLVSGENRLTGKL